MLQIIYKKSKSGRELMLKLREMGVSVSRTHGNKVICWNRRIQTDKPCLNMRYISKLEQLRKFHENNVSTIPFYENLGDALRNHPIVFGRLPNHQQGLDVRVMNENMTPRRREYYTAVLPKQAEYRIHVFCGKAVRSGKKIYTGENTPDPYGVWNLDAGFSVRYEYASEIPFFVRQLAKNAVAASGYDFGAVDVIKSNDKYYVLEVNTAPGLHGNTLLKYAEKVREWYLQERNENE